MRDRGAPAARPAAFSAVCGGGAWLASCSGAARGGCGRVWALRGPGVPFSPPAFLFSCRGRARGRPVLLASREGTSSHQECHAQHHSLLAVGIGPSLRRSCPDLPFRVFLPVNPTSGDIGRVFWRTPCTQCGAAGHSASRPISPRGQGGTAPPPSFSGGGRGFWARVWEPKRVAYATRFSRARIIND